MLTQTLSFKEALITLISLLIIMAASFFIGWKLGYQGVDSHFLNEQGKSRADVIRTIQILKDNYDGQLAEPALYEHTIKALIQSLNDPYSFYLTQDEYQTLQQLEAREFTGLGILYSVSVQPPVITAVLPGSPAETQGLKPDTQILTVNGTPTVGKSKPELMNLFQQALDQPVQLGLRDPAGNEDTIALKRAQFPLKNLTYQTLENKIGYLKLYQFTKNLATEFNPLVDQIQQADLQALIIDLRGNGGGAANQGVWLADQFLASGTIMQDQYHHTQALTTYDAKPGDPLEKLKVIILTDQHTASEAEVFAAALRENERATLIGQKTQGKGTQQSYFPLSDLSAIYLSSGKWLTPKGNWLQGKGIAPDIEVVDDLETEVDEVIEKGVLYLTTNEDP